MGAGIAEAAAAAERMTLRTGSAGHRLCQPPRTMPQGCSWS